MDSTIQSLIERLDLKPHPEGGYYSETYRSANEIPGESLDSAYSGNRNHSTCIYFLLVSGKFSAFHKINQDEIWHFYDGSPVELHTIDTEGNHQKHMIGRDFKKGETPQLVVSGGSWFASKVVDGDSYSLVGCTVAPGFDFDDFQLAEREILIQQYPQHQDLIEAFTVK